MSVRDGLLAILTLGPAYGLQLHGELSARSPHRARVNPGQIYATLDRLMTAGHIESAGATDDGLPLYALAEAGRTAAVMWLETPVWNQLPEWTEMLDQVLIGATLDSTSTVTLVSEYREWWVKEREDALRLVDGRAPESPSLDLLAASARVERARAAVVWLDAAAELVVHEHVMLPYSTAKPRRGRRRSADIEVT